MSMKRLNGWSVTMVLLLPVGCKGGGSGGPATTSDFCMQYADAICQVATPCGVSTTGCVTFQESQCAQRATGATTGTQRVYVPGNAAACINSVHSAYSGTQAITPPTLANIDRACGYVFQGKGVVLVDACTTQFDCAGATDGSIICDKGFCATQINTNAGQPCSDPGRVCVAGNYCAANAGGNKVCTAAGASGDACDPNTPCGTNLRCENATCTTLADSGASCVLNSDCSASAPYCDQYRTPPACDQGLLFAPNSTSCTCIAVGPKCIGNLTGAGGVGGGAGGASGSSGVTGVAGAAGGASGSAGATGGTGGISTGGAAGAAGAAGGHSGAGGTATSDTPA